MNLQIQAQKIGHWERIYHLTRTPEVVFGHRLSLLIDKYKQECLLFKCSEPTFAPPALGMSSITISILILQILGYVLSVVGFSLCVSGKSPSRLVSLCLSRAFSWTESSFFFFFFLFLDFIFLEQLQGQSKLEQKVLSSHIPPQQPLPQSTSPTRVVNVLQSLNQR